MSLTKGAEHTKIHYRKQHSCAELDFVGDIVDGSRMRSSLVTQNLLGFDFVETKSEGVMNLARPREGMQSLRRFGDGPSEDGLAPCEWSAMKRHGVVDIVLISAVLTWVSIGWWVFVI